MGDWEFVFDQVCYNAQEEIWRASLDEVKQVEALYPSLGKWLLPPCGLRARSQRSPVCPEGIRYCGTPVWRHSKDEYLRVLANTLPRVLSDAAPDLVLYIAGADPHEGDSLGRLSLSFDGLARRDAFVLALCREVGLPVAITIGGGYGRRIDDTVAIHAETARIAGSFV